MLMTFNDWNNFNTYTTYNIIWQNNDIHDSNASCLKHRLVYSQALFPSPFAMSITIPTLHSFCCSCPYVLIPSGVAPTERVHVTIQNWGIIVLCGCENWLSQMLEEVVCQLGTPTCIWFSAHESTSSWVYELVPWILAPWLWRFWSIGPFAASGLALVQLVAFPFSASTCGQPSPFWLFS